MVEFFSLAFSLFLLMDPIGNVPIYIALLKEMPPKRQFVIILRELIIALVFIIFFYLVGNPFLEFLKISHNSVMISGGIILFLIALNLIFGKEEPSQKKSPQKEPFVVPLAVPLVAGPAILAAVMVYSRQEYNVFIAIGAICLAWIGTTAILLSSTFLQKILGERGINACEKLMGLILIMIAIQMFLDGIKEIF